LLDCECIGDHVYNLIVTRSLVGYAGRTLDT